MAEIALVRASQPRVGVRKLHKALGTKIGRDRLFELMRKHDLLVRRRRSFRRTTYAGRTWFPNRIKNRPPSETTEALASDITYVPTTHGFSYLSLVTHMRSRKILGYDLRRDLSSEGPLSALRMAIAHLGCREGVIHHSDRGYQYSSRAFVDLARQHKIAMSMTEEDHVYENALAERVNGILKDEFLLGEPRLPHDLLREQVARSIQVYNDDRLHTSLNYRTPSEVFG